MSDGINGGFSFRNYQFLDFTKQVAQDQIELGKQPTETWAQIGNTFRRVCWNNTRNVFYTGLDVTTYLAVSILRSQGFCLPPLAAPPSRSYHDDAQFLNCAVERGVWTWNSQKKADIEEAIETCFSDEYNILAVVGEFCIAFSYESDNGKYIPSFLRASEPLENNESFHTIGKRFSKLGSTDKRNILQAIYAQKEPKSLSSKAKQVHKDIRALASKLQQGNKGYLGAFQAYTKTNLRPKENEMPRSVPAPRSNAYPTHPTPATPPRVMPTPSAPPRSMPIPSAPPREVLLPSAPPGGPDPMAYHVPEIQMAEELSFVRRALAGCEDLKRQITRYQKHHTDKTVAALMIVQALRDKLARRSTGGCLPMLERAHPRSVEKVSSAFSRLSDQQFKDLIKNLVNPSLMIPSGFMHFYHELWELAHTLKGDPVFEQVFAALQIDLIAH